MKKKIKITNSEYINKLIQEKLFELGFKFTYGVKNIVDFKYFAIDPEYQNYIGSNIKRKGIIPCDTCDYPELTIDELMKLTPEDFNPKEYIQVEKKDLNKLFNWTLNVNELINNIHYIKRKYNL